MPKVTTKFHQALVDAIKRFIRVKQYADGKLPERFQNEVALMQAAIAKACQNDRMLRDEVLAVCHEINHYWRNRLSFGSLLVDYIQDVIAIYPLDVLYEKQCLNLEAEVSAVKQAHQKEVAGLHDQIASQAAEIERLKHLLTGVQGVAEEDYVAKLRELLDQQSEENLQAKARLLALVREVDEKSTEIAKLSAKVNTLHQQNEILKQRLQMEFAKNNPIKPATQFTKPSAACHKHMRPDSPLASGAATAKNCPAASDTEQPQLAKT